MLFNTIVSFVESGRESIKTNKQPFAKETKLLWSKIWKKREHNRMAKWISNTKKELQGLEIGREANVHMDSQGVTL